jgi:general secretion pathway protein K
MRRKINKGSILVTALAVMALTAGISTSLLMRQSIEIKKTELMLIQDKLFSYAQGVEAWGIGELLKAASSHPKNQQADDLTQDWAKPYQPREIDGVTLTGRIIDLQGFFNVNTLLFEEENEEEAEGNPGEKGQKPEADKDKEKKIAENYLPSQVLMRLLQNLPGSEVHSAEATVNYIKDWISSQERPSDQEYEQGAMGFPYAPAKRPLISVSELRLVMGIDAQTMGALLPLVSALPLSEPETDGVPGEAASKQNVQLSKININTAPPLVLTALFDTQPEAALDLVAARPFKDMQKVKERLAHLQNEGLSANVINQWLDVKSDYFMIESKAVFRNYDAVWYTVVYRSPEKKIEVLYRMRGVY